jgi:glycosyltransferase involved in cell wall biosynthesis|tara:strand:- start:366 stop:1394 length:1029 start_codon:yes stop_codon:yes gene_type:complete
MPEKMSKPPKLAVGVDRNLKDVMTQSPEKIHGHAAVEPEGSDPLSLILIVPAYNESETISGMVRTLSALKPAFASDHIEMQVYVVDDGSQDGTGDLAQSAGADRVLTHGHNRGLGSAVRTGLFAARSDRADIVVKLDADLQHDPDDIYPLIQPILLNQADIVYGDRTSFISYRMSFTRRIGNKAFTRLMSWLTKWPLVDSQPGIIALNQAYIRDFWLPGDYNYTQQILLDAYHRGMRFAHVDVNFHQRKSGNSFVSLRYPLIALSQIMLVLIGIKPMKVFAPIGIIFLGLAFVIAGYQLVEWVQGVSDKPVQNFNFILGLSLFGLQTLFFGFLAELIVRFRR